MDDRFINNVNGFTLLETLIAMSILAYGLIAIMAMQVVALKVNHNNNLIQIARNILVSEVDKVMSLTNLQLKKQIVESTNCIGKTNQRNLLGTPFNSELFNTATIDHIPTGFDYVRWDSYIRKLNVNSSEKGENYYFLVKIAIDEKFLLQDILARGQVIVYWPSKTRRLDSLKTTFFIQRK